MRTLAMTDETQPPTRRRAKVVALAAALVLLGVACPAAPRATFVVPGFAPPAPAAFAGAPAPGLVAAAAYGTPGGGYAAFPTAAFQGPEPRWQDPLMKAARIRVGDQVKVVAGDYKGDTGKVLKIDRKKDLVIVEGIKIATKHVKPVREGETGSIVKKEMPIHASNLKVIAGEEEEADDAGDAVTVDVEPVAAAAVMGMERSPGPVMRIGARSWVPFMSEATEDEVAEEAAEEADAAEEPAAEPKARAPKKKDVSDWVDVDEKELFPATVSNVAPYGAFVKLADGTEGLVHISQMSDSYVENPSEIVKAGDEVQVRVIKVDVEKNQVALSMKSPQAARPPRRQGGGGGDRATKKEQLKQLAETADDTVFLPGTVVSIQSFGAFVKLQDSGVEGLVHVSQIKAGYIGAVSDEVAVGDEVQVRVVSVDLAKNQLELSMKEYSDGSEDDDDDSEGGGRNSDRDPALFTAAMMSDEELAAIEGLEPEVTGPDWLQVAMERSDYKKAKKQAKEKYMVRPM